MRRRMELDNAVAAGLAGSEDQILKTLEAHLDCDVFLRGNMVTLEGADAAVEAGETVVRELAELIADGHEIAPGTIEAVTRALDQHESPARILEDVVWRHRSTKVAPKTLNQKLYVESIRNNTITFGIGPAGTGKTFLAVAMAAAALSHREGSRIILTRPARRGGGRAPRLPARGPDGEGRPVPETPLRRPPRHDGSRAGHAPSRARRDRGRSAGIHARAGTADVDPGPHARWIHPDRQPPGRRPRRRL